MTDRARVRQQDITRAIRAAQAAGLRVIEIDAVTGRITTASQATPEPQLTAAKDPAQRALERRAKAWSGGAG